MDIRTVIIILPITNKANCRVNPDVLQPSPWKPLYLAFSVRLGMTWVRFALKNSRPKTLLLLCNGVVPRVPRLTCRKWLLASDSKLLAVLVYLMAFLHAL